jgi:hypothetical protein
MDRFSKNIGRLEKLWEAIDEIPSTKEISMAFELFIQLLQDSHRRLNDEINKGKYK